MDDKLETKKEWETPEIVDLLAVESASKYIVSTREWSFSTGPS